MTWRILVRVYVLIHGWSFRIWTLRFWVTLPKHWQSSWGHLFVVFVASFLMWKNWGKKTPSTVMSTPDFLNSPSSTSRNIQMVLTPSFFSTAKKRWTKTHVFKKPTISSKPHQFWRDMYRNLTLDVLEFCFRTLVVFQPSRPNRSCNDPSSQDAEV